MNEEEKEAIERAKFLVSIPTYLEKEMCKNLLNYIEKLQKENTELKEKLDYYKQKELQAKAEPRFW